MKRLVLAAAAALTLSACSPSGAVDAKDPWATLQPWNHARADVQKLPEGVEYVVVQKGDGKGPNPGSRDMVEVKYAGRIAETGIEFDSSYARGDTAKFRLNGVIPGWTQGIQKMQPGDHFMFWIPAKQGYGERGSPPKIEPNTDLMFQVELLKVIPDGWAKAMPWPTDSSEVQRRPSGLEYFPVESGSADGPSPTDADIAIVHFEGRLEGVKAEEGETRRRASRPQRRAFHLRRRLAQGFPGEGPRPRLGRSRETDAHRRPLDGPHARAAGLQGRRRWPHPARRHRGLRARAARRRPGVGRYHPRAAAIGSAIPQQPSCPGQRRGGCACARPMP